MRTSDHTTDTGHRPDPTLERDAQHRDDRPRPGRVHLDTAREAGLGRTSLLSIVAGTMCAYGAFAIVAAIAGALLTNTDLETDFRTDDWTSSGAAAGLVTALVLFAAYLFGGYVAGRMARRSGMLHGVGVFILSLVVGMLVGSMASLADGVDVADNLRSIGVPTDWDQVESVGVAAAIASLAAILLGSVLGGTLGERWHTKLARRFEDPAYGPAAEAQARAEREDEAHRSRREVDPTLAHDTDRVVDRDHDSSIEPDHDLERNPDRNLNPVAHRNTEPEPEPGHGQDRDLDQERIDALVDERVEQRLREIDERRRSAGPGDEVRSETIDLRPPPPPPAPQADQGIAPQDQHSGRPF